MRKASLLVLFLTVFIDLLGFGIVIPLLPYYARTYGATGLLAGSVLAVYSLMQFVFAPLWGGLSDRIGRRPVLLVSLTGSVLGYLLFAFTDSLLGLVFSRIVAGIAAANIGTAQAYIADITAPENRAKGMGMIGAAFGLGFIAGPPIGGLLYAVGTEQGLPGNRLPGLAAAGLSLAALSLAIFALRESHPPRKDAPKRLSRFDRNFWANIGGNRTLVIALPSLFLIVLAFAGMETTATLHGKDRFNLGPREIGYFFGFMGIIVALIQGTLIGRLSGWLGESKLVLIGSLSLMGGFALVPGVHRGGLLYGAAFLIAIGQGLCYPSLNAMVSRAAADTEQGATLGVSSSISALARIFGPLLGGAMYDAYASAGAFYAAALICALAAVLMFPMASGRVPARAE